MFTGSLWLSEARWSFLNPMRPSGEGRLGRCPQALSYWQAELSTVGCGPPVHVVKSVTQLVGKWCVCCLIALATGFGVPRENPSTTSKVPCSKSLSAKVPPAIKACGLSQHGGLLSNHKSHGPIIFSTLFFLHTANDQQLALSQLRRLRAGDKLERNAALVNACRGQVRARPWRLIPLRNGSTVPNVFNQTQTWTVCVWNIDENGERLTTRCREKERKI